MNQTKGKEENFEFKDNKGKVIYKLDNLQKMVQHFFLNLSVNHECMAEKGTEDSG